MKYCKECKFVRRNWPQAILSLGLSQNQWKFAKCSHAKAIGMTDKADNLMAREISVPTQYLMYCSTMRNYDHLCGEDPKYYEEKE